MTEPLGLSTYRWNNNIKSLVMLAAFPCLLVFIVTAFFTAKGYFESGQNGFIPAAKAEWFGYYIKSNGITVYDFAYERTLATTPLILLLSSCGIVISLWFNLQFMTVRTRSTQLDRAKEPRTYNLLENLCISCGARMPELYVIERPSLNAFSSGLCTNNYAITVTRGLINQLTDAELEAVLAHELSHILNGDAQLFMLADCFSSLLLFLPIGVWEKIFMMAPIVGEEDTTQQRTAIILIGFLLLPIAMAALWGGYILSILLRIALSYKKEYQADALAAAMTKNPGAMLSALDKIEEKAGLAYLPESLRALLTENTSSTLIFFCTHPPIRRRMDVLYQLAHQTPTQVIPATRGP